VPQISQLRKLEFSIHEGFGVTILSKFNWAAISCVSRLDLRVLVGSPLPTVRFFKFASESIKGPCWRWRKAQQLPIYAVNLAADDSSETTWYSKTMVIIIQLAVSSPYVSLREQRDFGFLSVLRQSLKPAIVTNVVGSSWAPESQPARQETPVGALCNLKTGVVLLGTKIGEQFGFLASAYGRLRCYFERPYTSKNWHRWFIFQVIYVETALLLVFSVGRPHHDSCILL